MAWLKTSISAALSKTTYQSLDTEQSQIGQPPRNVALGNYQKLNSSGTKRVARKILLIWSEIPEWMRFNPYILTGYRSPNGTYYTCVKSILEIHNETMNIWTHMLGLIATVLCFLQFFFYQEKWSSLSGMADLAVSNFFVCCVACLSCSCTYHIFACHSKTTSVACNYIDYVGITFLITGSWGPIFHNFFYCEPEYQVLYTTAIIVCGIITGAILVLPRFQNEKYVWFRTSLFLLLGVLGFIPCIHSGILHGVPYLLDNGLKSFIVMCTFYTTGALTYAAKIPERLYPGSFDIWFQSHSIFHIVMLFGLTSYYYGILQGRDFWMAQDSDAQYCSALLLS